MSRPPLVLLSALRRVRARLAWLAAERGAVRGLLVGLAVACVALLLRNRLPIEPPVWQLGLVPAAAGALLGALVGGLASLRGPASLMGAARAADRDLALGDRLATALELAAMPNRGPFGDACIRDAAHVAARLEAGRVGRRVWSKETRLVPAVGALAVVLAFTPTVPVDDAVDALVAALGSSGMGQEEPAEEDPPETRRQELNVKEALRREAHEGALPQAGESLALGAVFKDTKLSQLRPDTNAFLGTSDERLKLLRQPGELPDLRQEARGSGYHLRLKRMQEELSAVGNAGISKKQFAELTERLRQMGRERGGRSGAFDKALRDSLSAYEAGDTDQAMDSMERALDALGEGDGQVGDGSLPPGSEDGGWPEDLSGHAGLPQDSGADGPDGEQAGAEDGTASHGSEAGSGGSGDKAGDGEDAPEWAANAESFVEGMVSQGESEAYDSDVTGRGAKAPSRLSYMNVFQEYRKQVEEALVKEAVPLEARERVRAYFRSLEE
ncbi:MAG TPA: hypothetical protein VIM86_02720 [Thermodesulfobacteriota bacterium]